MASKESNRLHASAQDGMWNAPMPVDPYQLALTALFIPLMDDDEPLRWTDAAIDFDSHPGISVTVDSEPLIAHRPIPATAFTVCCNIDRYAPEGAESATVKP